LLPFISEQPVPKRQRSREELGERKVAPVVTTMTTFLAEHIPESEIHNQRLDPIQDSGLAFVARGAVISSIVVDARTYMLAASPSIVDDFSRFPQKQQWFPGSYMASSHLTFQLFMQLLQVIHICFPRRPPNAQPLLLVWLRDHVEVDL
jgi:hypothetical protein